MLANREGRHPVITSEGADEVFMDLVDGNLTWAEPTDREIPMMEMVYSGTPYFSPARATFRRAIAFSAMRKGRP